MYKTSEEIQKALKDDGRQFDFEKKEFSVGESEKLHTFEKAFQNAKKVYGKNGSAIIRYKAGHGVCEIGTQGVWFI